MHRHRLITNTLIAIGCVCLSTGSAVTIRSAEVRTPMIRVHADGPSSFITSIRFAPDGKTLYAAGWDKVVRAWHIDAEGQFHFNPSRTLRIPIGPGSAGVINAMEISSDGRWLAVGGVGRMRGTADFRTAGRVTSIVGASTEQLQDAGLN